VNADNEVIMCEDDCPEGLTVVTTPVGEEVVYQSDLVEETRQYRLNEVAVLLIKADPHQHPTARAMPAVKT